MASNLRPAADFGSFLRVKVLFFWIFFPLFLILGGFSSKDASSGENVNASSSDSQNSNQTAVQAPNQTIEKTIEKAVDQTIKRPKLRKGTRREKEAEGTQAPNRFDNDSVIKSRYELNGQPLEVDTD